MKHLQNSWRSFLILSLFLGFAITFRAYLITNIFEPIAMLFWAAWRIVSSVHQNAYWIILIVICAIPVIRLIPFGQDMPSSAYGDDYSSINRVEDWLMLVKNAPLGVDETEYLRNRLKRLLRSTQQLERFPSAKPDETSLPLTLRRFLFPTKDKHNKSPGDYRLQLLFLTPKWFRRWAGKKLQINNTEIDETLTWMESLMEINHDQ